MSTVEAITQEQALTEYRALVIEAAGGKPTDRPRLTDVLFLCERTLRQFSADVESVRQRLAAGIEAREAAKLTPAIESAREAVAELDRKMTAMRQAFEAQLVPIAAQRDAKQSELDALRSDQATAQNRASETIRRTSDAAAKEAETKPLFERIRALERRHGSETSYLPQRIAEVSDLLEKHVQRRESTGKLNRQTLEQDIASLQRQLENYRGQLAEVETIPNQVAKLRDQVAKIGAEYAKPERFKLAD